MIKVLNNWLGKAVELKHAIALNDCVFKQCTLPHVLCLTFEEVMWLFYGASDNSGTTGPKHYLGMSAASDSMAT